jgi:hypothetical protein
MKITKKDTSHDDTRPFPQTFGTLSKRQKKKKVNLSVCLISKTLCHEDVWGSGGIPPPFITSALLGGEWSASRPYRFRERAPDIHWIGGWVGSRAGLDAAKKRIILHFR